MEFSKLMEEFAGLLKKVKDLIDLYEKRLKDLKIESDEFAAKQKSLNDAQKNFADREAKVKDIEDFIVLKSESLQIKQEAEDALRKTQEDRKSFEEYRNSETLALNDLRLSQKKEAENNSIRSKQLDDEVNSRVNDFLVKNGFKKES